MNKRRKQWRNANLMKAGTAFFLLVLIFGGITAAMYLIKHDGRTVPDSAVSDSFVVCTGELSDISAATTEQAGEAVVPFIISPEKTDKSKEFTKD
jgi:D-alanyl-D-alanine carboxypeptidase (penicillin-binding protein 5/6)